MKSDAAEHVTAMSARPRSAGPGSGKDAWKHYAERLEAANASLAEIINEQSAAIRERDIELDLLRRQIASRKPKGGKPRTPQPTLDRIEDALRQGFPARHIAHQFHVSAMTVSRTRKHMEARDRAQA